MKIRRIKLSNYCQHEDLEVEFHGRLVGIVGENGSGKTNLVSCIHEVITGKFRKPKDKTLTFGASKGSIEVEMEMGGSVLVASRDLHGSGCMLSSRSLSGKEAEWSPVSSADRMNSILGEIFPYPPQVLRGVVFTPQEDITSLLFDPKPSVRERMAASFFGVDRASEAEEAVSKVVADVPVPQPPRNFSSPEEAEARVRESMEALEDLTQKASRAEAEEDKARRQLDKDRETASMAEDWIAWAQRTDEASRSARKAEEVSSRISRVLAEISSIEEDLDGVDSVSLAAELDSIRNVESLRAESSRAERILASARESHREALELLESVSDTEEEIARLKERARIVTEELARERMRLSSRSALDSAAGTECPMCMRGGMTEPDIARIRKTLPEVRKSVSDLEEDLERTTSRERKLTREISRAVKDESEAKHALSAAEKTAELAARRLAEAVEKTEADFGKVRNQDRVSEILSVVLRAERDLSAAKDELSALEAERDELASAPAPGPDDPPPPGGFGSVPDALAAVRKRSASAEALSAAQSAAAQAASARDAMEAELRSATAALEDCTDYLRRKTESDERRAMLSAIRAVFHYSAAPKMVVGTRLKAVSGRINSYLDDFGASFRVDAKEGFDFDCVFGSRVLGRVVSPQSLSGGEKVALSVAFRLAAAETFCSEIGFLVLDEPTVWMDRKRREGIPNVMSRLARSAEEVDGQYLVVTHDETLMDCFDQIIQL